MKDHEVHRGCPRPERRSILDSERYPGMDMDSKLAALVREAGHLDRFHMEDKGSQNRILHILLEDGPMSQKALTERIGIQPGSASEVLGKLEKAGLIRRTIRQTDRRGMDLALTELGRDQAQKMARQRQERKARQFSVLSEAEKAALLPILEKLVRDWHTKEKRE